MAHSNKTISNPQTGQQLRFIRTSSDTNGHLLEMEARFRANSIEPAAHYHPRQTEDFKVLSGQLTVKSDGQTKILRQGDTLHIPLNTVHSMWNSSAEETVVNWQVTPALDTEYFFETAFGLASDGKVGSNGMPPLLQTALLSQHFSGIFRLAKPPRAIQMIVFGLLSPLAYLMGFRPTYRKYMS